MIARTTPWGTIEIGKDFLRLSYIEMCAVISHEEGHVHYRHSRKRLWWVLTLRTLFNWDGFLQMCEQQELEADRYAVANGHKIGLLSLLSHRSMRLKVDGYPNIARRLENIHV